MVKTGASNVTSSWKKRHKKAVIRGSAILILVLIWAIKGLEFPLGLIHPDPNPINDLHWSFYILTFIGSLFYVMNIYHKHKGVEDFDPERAGTGALMRIAEAQIYMMIILNVYGSSTRIPIDDGSAVSGAVIALLIGMYVKLFESAVRGIAETVADGITPDRKRQASEFVQYEKVKSDLVNLYRKAGDKLGEEAAAAEREGAGKPDTPAKKLQALERELDADLAELEKYRSGVDAKDWPAVEGFKLAFEGRVVKMGLRY